jgi:hypothetical protein
VSIPQAAGQVVVKMQNIQAFDFLFKVIARDFFYHIVFRFLGSNVARKITFPMLTNVGYVSLW